MYKDFHKFISGLQNEILRAEFFRYSLGSDCISPLQFAQAILRFADLPKKVKDKGLQNVAENISFEGDTIDFDSYSAFFYLLFRFEDLYSALKMYVISNRAISRGEFSPRFVIVYYWQLELMTGGRSISLYIAVAPMLVTSSITSLRTFVARWDSFSYYFPIVGYECTSIYTKVTVYFPIWQCWSVHQINATAVILLSCTANSWSLVMLRIYFIAKYSISCSWTWHDGNWHSAIMKSCHYSLFWWGPLLVYFS